MIVQNIIVSLIVVLSVCAHECGHGLAAWHFGDPSALVAGRITLNPLKHFDLIGGAVVPGFSIWLLGFPFGWAKSIPVDATCMTPKQYAMVVAAGPVTNLLLAAIALPWMIFGFDIARYFLQVNVALCIFNLLPIPGFDGWQIIRALRVRSKP